MTKINHPYITNKGNIARTGATNLRISTKNSVEISRFITGLGVDSAIEYLENVVIKKKPIPYKRYIRDQAHRKGGVGPGRYPVNAVKEFITLLQNVKNNAEVKGLDVARLVVKNAQANIGSSRFRRGARMFGSRRAKSTNVSITVEQKKMKKTAQTAVKQEVGKVLAEKKVASVGKKEDKVKVKEAEEKETEVKDDKVELKEDKPEEKKTEVKDDKVELKEDKPEEKEKKLSDADKKTSEVKK
ncbi:MAG: 50S ribosomal protein L22 [archaeon]|nr:50S ribosomal protein L22 [archaeon]